MVITNSNMGFLSESEESLFWDGRLEINGNGVIGLNECLKELVSCLEMLVVGMKDVPNGSGVPVSHDY